MWFKIYKYKTISIFLKLAPILISLWEWKQNKLRRFTCHSLYLDVPQKPHALTGGDLGRLLDMKAWHLSVDWSTAEFTVKCGGGRSEEVGHWSMGWQDVPLFHLFWSFSTFLLYATKSAKLSSAISPCLRVLWTETSINCKLPETFPFLTYKCRVFCLSDKKASKIVLNNLNIILMFSIIFVFRWSQLNVLFIWYNKLKGSVMPCLLPYRRTY